MTLNRDRYLEDAWNPGSSHNIGVGGPAGSKFQLGFSPDTSDITKGLRTASSVFGSAVADDIFSVYTVLGNYAFSTVIHALAQEKHSDVLSAPKITTVSGGTGQVKVVTVRYFPEEWEAPEFNTNGDNATATSYPPAIPQFGDGTEIGVLLDVTPVVASDKYTIDLDLQPQVVDFLGYDNSFNTTTVVNGFEMEQKFMMPILTKREAKTKLIVFDGETVVLGGMILEKLDKYEDKVPFLGDLPLLGRLFRMNGEQSVKTNLLMFVNARLVQPNGQPKRPEVATGIPDFRH